MKKLTIELNEQSRQALEQVRDTHAKAYMRERASAILQIADGRSGRWVAFHGLLKARRKNTVYEWARLYQEQGIKGLEIKEGRGRKPSFFPT